MCDHSLDDVRDFVGESGGVPTDVHLFMALIEGIDSSAQAAARRIANTPAPIAVASILLAERARASHVTGSGPTRPAETRGPGTAYIHQGVRPRTL